MKGQQPLSSYSKNFLQNPTTGNVGQYSLYSTLGFSLGSPYYSYRKAYPDERKWQIGDTLSITVGKHNIRVGEDIVHNYDLQNAPNQINGAFTYSTNIVNYISDALQPSGTCNTALTRCGHAALLQQLPAELWAVRLRLCHRGLCRLRAGRLEDRSTPDVEPWRALRLRVDSKPVCGAEQHGDGSADGGPSQRQEQPCAPRRLCVGSVRPGQDGAAWRLRHVLRPHREQRSAQRADPDGLDERRV